jgi:hypothetical protein
MNQIEKRPSRQTLDATLLRALVFLRVLGRNPKIADLLSPRGYTDEEHDEGWNLLLRASGYRFKLPKGAAFDSEARRAQTELDQWDEPNFQIAQGALRRKHPAQHDFVFEALSAEVGPGSMLTVQVFLDRLDELESSPEREATRAQDHAALATLAARGIDSAERQRVRELLKSSQRLSLPPAAADDSATKATQDDDLFALYLWYKDWSGTARTLIKRRDYLVNLGLATRRVEDPDAVE